MRKNYIRLIFLLLLSCEFKASPYSTKTPKVHRNETNLELIRANESSTGSSFKIAFLADTHNYYDQLRQAIKQINKNGPYSFVVVNGDITNYGLLEEFDETRSMLNKLAFPYLVVIGNHDLLANGADIYDKMFGPTDFSLIYKNVHFIFFNNNNWEASGIVPDKNQVETTLISSPSPFRVIAAHVSPTDEARFTQQEINEWETLMTTYGVNYFFNGHNHNPQEGTLGSAKAITIGSPSKGSYYELIVTPGGLTHQKISF